MMTSTTAALLVPLHLAFGMPGGWEWIVLLVIGLLIFGRRLPEVGKWLGQGIVEFKRGIKGIDEEIEQHSSRPEGLRPPGSLPDQSAPKTSTHTPVESATQER